ncbi:tripartite tricarboxylate transporter permease [Halalkalibacterium ligniniphilum]|uniref:tripartite tricarboxylate transporter permease n=1 Tax=Halalkalibacterium ligniniphilum TaxID=1134413 RepID=UPI0003459A17|nr:tripartite tricarboxylate transporter permease [Halalkalibacterium ligniniphilum]
MGWFEGLGSGFLQAISIEVLPYIIVGAVFGLIIGIIPGLNGHFAMAMLIPFLYTMDPAPGIAFLLAAHATVAQGGGLTAILFNTPGTGQNAATLLDGPPMTKKGQAGRAVGAAMSACFLGAAFGAVALALMIPILQKIVLFFGPAEIFMLAFLALTFVAVLGKEDMTRGIIAAFLGLLLAMVGMDNVTNEARFTFGSVNLIDGLKLVPVILGLFAVSEMISLWIRGGSLSDTGGKTLSTKQMQVQIFQGIGETFKKWWLVLRCSSIGTIMGLIPGLGSAPAAFVAYGHAKQTSKHPETFGKGEVEGVIGPESANDAVEGGALASTIAFGIPGSSSMAILLGGLFILGYQTGPSMINNQVDVVFLMVMTIILGNLIGTLLGMFIVNPLARITFLRGTLLVPILVVVIFTGAYASYSSWFDIGIALLFGIIGYAMKEFEYSRAALLIGFVLGFTVERNLYLALNLGGPFFFLEPIPLLLLVITLAFLAYNIWTYFRDKNKNIEGGQNIGG